MFQLVDFDYLLVKNDFILDSGTQLILVLENINTKNSRNV